MRRAMPTETSSSTSITSSGVPASTAVAGLVATDPAISTRPAAISSVRVFAGPGQSPPNEFGIDPCSAGHLRSCPPWPAPPPARRAPAREAGPVRGMSPTPCSSSGVRFDGSERATTTHRPPRGSSRGRHSEEAQVDGAPGRGIGVLIGHNASRSRSDTHTANRVTDNAGLPGLRHPSRRRPRSPRRVVGVIRAKSGNSRQQRPRPAAERPNPPAAAESAVAFEHQVGAVERRTTRLPRRCAIPRRGG